MTKSTLFALAAVAALALAAAAFVPSLASPDPVSDDQVANVANAEAERNLSQQPTGPESSAAEAPADASEPDPTTQRDANGTAAPTPAGHANEAPALPPTWTPGGAIHPGIQTFTEGAQCTANFVFYDAADIYIGQAAHCAGTGAATDTNGCTAGTHPLGTPVDLGTGNPGTLAYSSWIAMQEAGTPDSAPECYGNDFALIKVAEEDEANVDPAVPFFGGPVGLAPTAGLGVGDAVYSFGNSGLRLGIEPALSWKHGTVVSADAWGADLYTATPGIPGDSGSGFLDADGNALGVLSTVALLPLPLSNYISGLASALAYAPAHGGPDVALATAPWTGGIV